MLFTAGGFCGKMEVRFSPGQGAERKAEAMADTMIPGGVVAMMGEAVDRLMKLDSGDAALLYLYCLRHGSANGLNWPEQRLRPAFEQLRSQGLAPREAALPDPPVQIS